VVVVLAVVAVLIALSTIPITSSFSLTVAVRSDYQQFDQPSIPPVGVATLSPPAGSHVWGAFATDGRAAVFEIQDSGGLVYLANSSCGTFSFIAAPPVWFEVWAGPSVSVSGQYSSPIL
jgi:hypothetical protein